MWALLPLYIFISISFVWETFLNSLLLAVLLLLTLRLRERPGNGWDWLGFGVLWGFGVLSNASLLSLFPFLAGWAIYPLWKGRPGWLTAAPPVALGLAVIFLPLPVRNYRPF